MYMYSSNHKGVQQLPCMIGGFPEDCHPASRLDEGEHSFMHTYLNTLFETDWNAATGSSTRGEIMGGEVMAALAEIQSKITDASKYRLLVSFNL